jgi:hypothetical protein
MGWIKTDGNWGVDGGSGGTSTKGSCVVMNRHGTGPNSWSGLGLLINAEGTVNLQAKNATAQVANPKSTGTVTDNAWHHIAVTWNQASGGDMIIYIDGGPDGSATNSAAWSFSSQNVLMGDSPDTWWEEYSGRLDDVRVADYEMTESEINSIYLQGRQ